MTNVPLIFFFFNELFGVESLAFLVLAALPSTGSLWQ